MNFTPTLQSKDSVLERMFLVLSITLGAVVWLSFSFDRVHAEVPSVAEASEVRAYSRPAEAKATAVKKPPLLEMHIAPNGMVLLRGATVYSVSDTSLRVTALWETGVFTWDIEMNPFTKFLNSKGEKETIEELHAGDFVTVTGTLGKGGNSPSINADIVRIY